MLRPKHSTPSQNYIQPALLDDLEDWINEGQCILADYIIRAAGSDGGPIDEMIDWNDADFLWMAGTRSTNICSAHTSAVTASLTAISGIMMVMLSSIFL